MGGDRWNNTIGPSLKMEATMAGSLHLAKDIHRCGQHQGLVIMSLSMVSHVNTQYPPETIPKELRSAPFVFII